VRPEGLSHWKIPVTPIGNRTRELVIQYTLVSFSCQEPDIFEDHNVTHNCCIPCNKQLKCTISNAIVSTTVYVHSTAKYDIFCTRPDGFWRPLSRLYNGYRGFSSGLGIDHRLSSSAEVKERVELYLCFPCGPSCPILGWTLPLPVPLKNTQVFQIHFFVFVSLILYLLLWMYNSNVCLEFDILGRKTHNLKLFAALKT
jgi:hypothetical protein